MCKNFRFYKIKFHKKYTPFLKKSLSWLGENPKLWKSRKLILGENETPKSIVTAHFCYFYKEEILVLSKKISQKVYTFPEKKSVMVGRKSQNLKIAQINFGGKRNSKIGSYSPFLLFLQGRNSWFIQENFPKNIHLSWKKVCHGCGKIHKSENRAN